MIKAIIWDIGGVLIENPKYKEFWQGIKESERLRILFGERKISNKEFIKQGAKLLSLNKKEFLKRYKEAYWTGKRIESTIKIFKKTKVKKYLFSDTNPIHQEYLRKIGKDLFKEADKSFLEKRKKYLKSSKEVLKEIRLNPSEVIFIDDKEEYINVANKLKINAVLFKNTKQLKQDLRKYGVNI